MLTICDEVTWEFKAQAVREQIYFHSLRRFRATLCLKVINLEVNQTLLGWVHRCTEAEEAQLADAMQSGQLATPHFIQHAQEINCDDDQVMTDEWWVTFSPSVKAV
ncbi:hypothetical protein PR048_022192 [Dryococelus australis]|uniref:Uncharacterized protein n=1 Tax=Dryococelus australis TaxID=614101 RepID=A0ABQ9H0E5_9NEOP|nr:hypothetical protein PR048_022192 [Dryococelus australis]